MFLDNHIYPECIPERSWQSGKHELDFLSVGPLLHWRCGGQARPTVQHLGQRVLYPLSFNPESGGKSPNVTYNIPPHFLVAMGFTVICLYLWSSPMEAESWYFRKTSIFFTVFPFVLSGDRTVIRDLFPHFAPVFFVYVEPGLTCVDFYWSAYSFYF